VEVLADDAEDSLLAAGDGRGGEEVPASLVAAAEPPAAAGFDPLPEAEAARSLLRALEDGPAEQWQTATASAALDIGCLIRFGGELEELGRRHGWQALVQYGARIQSQAAQFELDALPDTLKTFPRLLSLLKSL
jgi:hypothetical protein